MPLDGQKRPCVNDAESHEIVYRASASNAARLLCTCGVGEQQDGFHQSRRMDSSCPFIPRLFWSATVVAAQVNTRRFLVCVILSNTSYAGITKAARPSIGRRALYNLCQKIYRRRPTNQHSICLVEMGNGQKRELMETRSREGPNSDRIETRH